VAAHDLGNSSLQAVTDSTEKEEEEGNNDLTVWQENIPFGFVWGWGDLCMLLVRNTFVCGCAWSYIMCSVMWYL